MIKNFSITNTPNLIFGKGVIAKLMDIIPLFGKEICIVRGGESLNRSYLYNSFIADLHLKEYVIYQHKIKQEPSAEDINNIVNALKGKQIRLVIAVGGGSVLDAGKAVSAMLTVSDNIENYLEGVGSKTHPGTKIPFIAVPTTSGTGSEATKNAVISKVGDSGYKKSLRHDNFVPDYAIIDPQLIISCPPEVTARSGLDAFTQLLESYFSTKANAFTDTLALQGLQLIQEYLVKAYNEPDNINARSALSYAAYLSGITLANAGLGTIHGFASSLGAKFNIPHGVICGTLIGTVNSATLKKIESGKDIQVLNKYATVGRLFSKRKKRSDSYYAWFLIEIIHKMVTELNIPTFGKYGVQSIDLKEIAKKTENKNNPVKFNAHELELMLAERL